ncbi:MAG: helix-turn-helix transcriptional regulator [Clostridiales bacterium]|nr:helix-turn-helix transcriptional regulator [Clostridiales bacterium]
MRDFAKRLYTLRQEKGVSARDMSLSLGQAHNYINGLESEKSFPAMQSFFYICEYLEISPQEFFDYANRTPTRANELYAEIMRLDCKSQVYFLNLIRDVNNRPR